MLNTNKSLTLFIIITTLLTISVPIHSAAPAPQHVIAQDEDDEEESEISLLARSGTLFVTGIAAACFILPSFRAKGFGFACTFSALSFISLGTSVFIFKRTELYKKLVEPWNRETINSATNIV